MRFRATSFFLRLVGLTLLALPTTSLAAATLTSIAHKSTPATLLRALAPDRTVQFKNSAEKNVVKIAFQNKKTPTEALTLKNSFVTTFLQITETWVHEVARSNARITTKTLVVHEFTTPKSKKIAFAVRFVFKKNKKASNILTSATILSPTSYAPEYIKNLIKTAFIDKTTSPKGLLGVVGIGGIVLLGYTFLPQEKTQALPNPKRREPPLPPQTEPEPQHFFAQCTQRLNTISQHSPQGTITPTKSSTTPTSLRFATTIDEDDKRGWSRTLNFELRKSYPEDRHSSTYVLYDNKYGRKNKLIYEINSVDDFTTAMLTHLLVRKVSIGPALVQFEKAILACQFKDSDVMKQFYKHNKAAGTLREALIAYKTTFSLDEFFANHR